MAVATVRAVLVAAAPVIAIVPEERIEPVARTQALAVPAITLQRVSSVPFSHLRGNGALRLSSVQVDCYAGDYTSARALADACTTALDAAGFTLQSEFDGGLESEPDPELFRVTQTWSVFTP
jgi:hypothetical protein